MPDVTQPDRLAALRIIDANFNRASEGLRVVEELCRLALNDGHLTALCKQLRHELAAAQATFSTPDLHHARETQADVGTRITTQAEGRRRSLAHIAAANWQRSQEALRAIEEYSKLVAPEVAAKIEALRYQSYTLAKACTITFDSQERLAQARLYVLIDGGPSEAEYAHRAGQLVAAGVHVLQLRDKKLDDRALLGRARLLRRLIDDIAQTARQSAAADRPPEPRPHEPGTPNPSPEPRAPSPEFRAPSPLFIINDRPDLAVLARADGVHLGQNELAVHDARQIVGPEMLIGVSTHSIEQARQAVLDGASYLGCGPTFPSGTKHFDQLSGLEFLRQVAAEIALPAFAIGGITSENLPQVMVTGFTRVAVSGAIANSQDATVSIERLLAALRMNHRDTEATENQIRN